MAGPVDQAGGQQVSRKRHRHQLGNAEPAAAWEAADRREPANRRAQNRAEQPFTGHEQQGALHLLGPIESEPEGCVTTADQGVLQQGDQGQQGEPAGHQDGHHKSGAAAGAQRTMG